MLVPSLHRKSTNSDAQYLHATVERDTVCMALFQTLRCLAGSRSFFKLSASLTGAEHVKFLHTYAVACPP